MTARPLDPYELLEQAKRLAGFEAGPGRPRSVDLRASVSRAYYALFHGITRRAAQALLDGTLDEVFSQEALTAARWVAHTDLKLLAQAVTGQSHNKALTPLFASASSDLVRVCEALVTLQGLRHLADYDHDFDIDRLSARAAVRSADDALSRLSTLRAGSDASYLRFLRLAGGAVKIAKAR